MNLETKITIYKFTPQVFTLTHKFYPSDKYCKAQHTYCYSVVAAVKTKSLLLNNSFNLVIV